MHGFYLSDAVDVDFLQRGNLKEPLFHKGEVINIQFLTIRINNWHFNSLMALVQCKVIFPWEMEINQ